MIWKLAADVVAGVHFLWIAFVVLGPIPAWRRPGWRAAHLAVLWGTAALWNFYCPLTVFETLLRAHHDPTVEQTGFLVRLFEPCVDLQRFGRPLALAVWGWAALWTAAYLLKIRRSKS